MYFNQVAYGGSTYGVEEAAWRYFNKSAGDLNLAESALLAGLPAAPSAYTPFGSNPELAYARQDEVFRLMVKAGYVTSEQVAEAKKAPLVLNKDVTDIKAPHFVMYVRQLLADQYGEDVLTTGGLEVKTTLDLDVQNQTQKLVSDEMATLTRLNINNGAALVTNPSTGEILAMVGSKNYFDFKNDGQVNVTTRARQPGSSIKPFTYALSLQQGKTPASMIQDEPITYISAGSKPYSPKNYDGKFHGSVSLREALGSSYNIPAVKTLNEVGLNNFIDLAQSLGINTWNDRSRFGLSLTLGSGEVRMIDLAQAYSVFPNAGHPVAPSPLLEVKNYRGDVLYRNECALDQKNCWQGDPIISPLVAYQITDILKDNKARTPAFGPSSVLFIPNQQVAVKTGTTNSMRDNWTMGYTSNRFVAVWVGNNDNTPMSYVASGITGASPIWNKIMRSLLDEKKPHQFALPADLIKVAICAKTGTLPCSGCPNVREEIFAVGTQPTRACSPSYFAQLAGAAQNLALPQSNPVTIDSLRLKKSGDLAVRKYVTRN
jgi:membrane peptidoglycan carboxypeptidase